MEISARDWQSLSNLLDTVLSLPVEARHSWVEELDAEHEPLKPVLRELLAREDLAETGSFLATLPKIGAPLQAARMDAQAGDLIGPYCLERVLGAGGMGSVWLAERIDGRLKRKVALKLPHLGGAVAGLAERMARERDILAALEHPHIARLYDAGIADDGRPYLALEYVEGEPCERYCETRNLDVAEGVRIIIQVARAVAFAHAHLVVHRDLKPSNILVDAQGEVHLLDFGIAKLLDQHAAAETPLTQATGRALTPDYASPEQIRGDVVSTASDVYSLGVVLYELLTGSRPYKLNKGEGALALAHAVLSIEPMRPSDAVAGLTRRRLRGDLDTIVLKALKKDPRERYGTMAELADDLERYLRDDPVRARPDSTWYRVRKFAGRHRTASTMSALLALVVAVGIAGVLRQSHITAQEARRAQVTKNFLVDIFRANDPRIASDRPRGQITARELMDLSADRIEQRFADDPQTQIELLGTVADIDHELGADDRFAALNARRMQLARQYLGDLSEPLIDSAVNAAVHTCRTSNWPACRVELEQADDLLNRARQNDSPMRASWWIAESWVLRAEPGAGERRRAALENATRIFSLSAPRDARRVAAIEELAVYYSETRDYDRAIVAFLQAIALDESLPDHNDADLQVAYGNLGVTYQQSGAYPEAIAAFKRSAELAERSVGVNFRTRWNTAANAARTLHLSGAREQGDAAFDQLLAVLPPPETHDGYAEVVRELYGACLAAEGRPGAAITLLEIAEQDQLRFPETAWGLRRIRLKLGDAYDRAGNTDKARTTLNAALEDYLAHDPPDSFPQLMSRERWGRFLLERGELAAAGEQFDTIVRRAPPQPSIPIALAHGDLARIALLRKEADAAMTESATALNLWSNRKKSYYDIRTEPYLQRIRADALAAEGMIGEAQKLEDQAWQASEKYDAPESPTRRHRAMK